MTSQIRRILVSGCLIFIAAITFAVAQGKPRKMQNIPAGMWGGQGISIQINGNTATVEYDCANGTISGPFKLDRNGKFNVSGRHVREHGGPIRLNEERASQPARFTGWTDGKKMTLTVTLENSKQDIGTFVLQFGSSGRLDARLRNVGSALTRGTTIGLLVSTTRPMMPSPTR